MESEVKTSGSGEASAPALGFGGKLVNIFTSPGKTFQELDQRPTWIAPVLILIVFIAVTTQMTFPIIMEAQMDNFRSNPNITPEQLEAIESQIGDNMNTQRIITLVSQIIVTPIVFLVLAGLFYLVGTVMLGGDSTYKRVLAVVAWSECISIIGVIVTSGLVMAKGSMEISLSPALLLSADAIGTKLHTFLSKFDFFTIWFLAVFATGFGYIYKFSTAKAYTAVGVLWAIWIALSVALSGVLKQFGM
ncbi:MAG: Yip1 family protein [candidate division Zixibacteria bacterium]